MSSAVERQLEQCIEDLRAGRLTEEALKQALETARRHRHGRQNLLYLQASKTSETSDVVGMRLIEDGVATDGPRDPGDWPYKTVLEAVNDGWRVIKFPELALLLDEGRTYGLGCEFVLERWSDGS